MIFLKTGSSNDMIGDLTVANQKTN